MEVIATKPGYFGRLRAAGDTFEVPDDAKGSWFEPVSGPVKEEPAEKKSGAKKAAQGGNDLV